MSTDLPFLGGCNGYSSSAISSYRHANHISPSQTYKAQMASLQKTIGSTLHASSSQHQAHGAHASTTQSLAPVMPTAHAPPTINLQPYVGPTSQSSVPSPTKAASVTTSLSSSKALEASSKLATPQFFPLRTVDFQIISETSVGGGSMGLPRPYGQFVATRGGDGLAVFERLPPHRGPGPSHSSAYPLNTRNDDAHELVSPPTDPIGSEGGLQSVEVPVFKSKSGLVLPMASRLKSSDLPENIRIDCGYGLTKSFMASRPGVALSPVKSPSSQQTKEAKESGAHTWAMTSMTEEEERRMEETVEMLTAISVGGSREGKVVDSTLAARNRASALPLEHTLPRRNTKPGK